MFTATFSAEDDKIRLYVGRVPRADYDALRAAGFTATPKQSCDFVATWTPAREDLAMEFLEDGEDIGDEDYSPEERAADRAERFGDYRDKRRAEAHGRADAFESGPAAFGHQNRGRAERQARRHDRHRGRATSQWSKAEYWQQRTAGVIAHALHKSSAGVRRGRILTIEADQRKNAKSREEFAARWAAWLKVLTLEGAECPLTFHEDGRYGTDKPAVKLAYSLANSAGCLSDYTHPRTGRTASLYSLLTDSADPLTAWEAASLWFADRTAPGDQDSSAERWARHYELRLGYERAMLAEEGGTAADADMVPGGFIGKHQIQKVNKSPVTGRVVSVELWGTDSGYTAASGYKEYATVPKLKTYNVERLPEGAYRAPTEAEAAAFAVEKADRKAEEKAGKPAPLALVNPTDADAQRLQDLWNRRAKEKHDQARKEGRVYSDFKPVEVLRVTQAEYSARSKGGYASCETRTLHACGKPARRSSNLWSSEGQAYDKALGAVVAKIRVGHDRVIVVTDKSQKALPLDWSAVESGTVPAAAEVVAATV